MERGLLWLPLLALFIGLAWAGWNEYQKLEAYRSWAAQFTHAKYDIFSVLGLNDQQITWGKPTRKGPVEIQTLALEDVRQISVTADGQVIDVDNPPNTSKTIALKLMLQNDSVCNIPFTQMDLAIQWANFLKHKAPLLNQGKSHEWG